MLNSKNFTETTAQLSQEVQLAKLYLQQTILENSFIPELYNEQGVNTFPSAPQAFFLTAPVREILYGGAAGGGKSAAILAAALQFVEEKGYDALIVRRNYTDLEKQGGLIPLSKEWLGQTTANYNDTFHRWTFPSGATLSFGHIQSEASVVQDFQGSAYAFIGFDELTQFTERMYTYLFSRLRKLRTLKFPVRMRATSNPGGEGHEWVKKRFVDKSDGVTRLFIPALLEDNPGYDAAEYGAQLDLLDIVTRRQLRHGDWTIRPEGNMFKREWFKGQIRSSVPNLVRKLRYWDLAATKVDPKKNKDPDYACGALWGVGEDGNFYLLDMKRDRGRPKEIDELWRKTTKNDTSIVSCVIEQEPGSAAKLYIDALIRSMPAYAIRGKKNSVDKTTRARPFSSACEQKRVFILDGEWNAPFLDELCVFPSPQEHDDMVDAAVGGYEALAGEAEVWTPDDVRSIFAKEFRT